MQQQLNFDGSLRTNDFNTPAGTGSARTFPGGYLALPSNMGEYHRTHFGVVPEVGLNLKYQLTQKLGVSLGYTALYLNSVVRPGEQIDRNVNGGQSSLYSGTPTPPGLQGGPAQPAPLFHTTDFWAQGINFGLLTLWVAVAERCAEGRVTINQFLSGDLLQAEFSQF